MADKLPNLDSVIPDSLKGNITRSLRDVLDKPMKIVSASFTKNEQGWKVTFKCHFPDEGRDFYLISRAFQPISVATSLVKSKRLPVMAKFVLEGQAVLLVDPAYEPKEAPGETLPDL